MDRERRDRVDLFRLEAARLRQRGASVVLLGFFCGIALVPWPLRANPAGADVVAGTAAITQAGNNLNVVNSSGAIINWQSFSIGAGEVTSFLQPSAASSVLNRVVGGDISAIYGTLKSNGQVYLINPNGIVVGATGMINTAGFVASTLDVSNAAFSQYAANGGTLSFLGSSAAKVQNLGTIAADGGNVFLIARQVDNRGTIRAAQGTAGLYAGKEVYLTTGQADAGNVQVTATSLPDGVLATGVSNSGVIEAVQAELKATGNMYALAINNTGTIRATGGTVGRNGVVHFVAMSGTVKNSGTITAKNADGVGGFIETSGKKVDLGGTIQTGRGGEWVIDPLVLDGSSIAVATLATQLGGGNVTETATTSISLDEALSWAGTGVLTLKSGGTIDLSGAITAQDGGLTLDAAGNITATGAVDVGTFTLQSGAWVQNTATLPAFRAANFVLAGGSFLRALGGNGSGGTPYLLADVYGLQGMNGFLSSSFSLANDIDASGTANWNGGAGFVPIGNYGRDGVSQYSGAFDGAGHTINHLVINLPTQDYAGLFGVANGATIENVGLVDVNVAGQGSTGGLIGAADASTVNNTYTTGTITGTGNYIGGLVGYEGSNAWVEHSYSTATVSGGDAIGGLVGGSNGGQITFSYATGAVSGGNNIGGLIGTILWGYVDHSYALGSATGTGSYVGGFVGTSGETNIQYSYAAGHVSGAGSNVGGFAGHDYAEQSYSYLTADYWDTDTSGTTLGVGTPTDYLLNGSQYPVGLTTAQMHDASNYGYWSDFAAVWYNAGGTLYPILQSEYSATIASSHQLELVGMNATTLAATYTLARDLDLANDPLFGAAGFTPIANYGVDGTSQFTGTFHGAGHVVKNLAIDLPAQDYVGLFGYVGSTGIVENLGVAGGSVTGNNDVGGLAGESDGTITASYATVFVSSGPGGPIGGLVGKNAGAITASYATGAVTSSGGSAGGLVGWNTSAGTIETSYAAGDVVAGGNNGGLVGSNEGAIDRSYALGNVTATTANAVGGLVGGNTGNISHSYAAGAVIGLADIGGFIGNNAGGVETGDYWNTDAAGTQATVAMGLGSASAGVTGVTTAQMMDPAYLSGLGSFTAGSGDWYIAGTGTYAVLQSELTGAAIRNSHQLELMGMSTNLGGSYVQANDIDLAGDPLFGAAGFVPIGNASTRFTGTFDGNGHAIDHLFINLPSQSDVGLFGVASGTIQNVGVVNVSVTGSSDVGGLIGRNVGATVDNAYTTGTVSGGGDVGGLEGTHAGTARNSHSTATVSGTTDVGGLVGYLSSGSVTGSQASGDVSGTNAVGGLVGGNGGTVSGSSAAGAVTASIGDNATASAGGLIGYNQGTVTRSRATGSVAITNAGAGSHDTNFAGGLVGLNELGGVISRSDATGAVSITIPDVAGAGYGAYNYNYAGGLVGGDGDYIAGSAGGTISASYATGSVTIHSTEGSTDRIGGLAGYVKGSVSDSYATGNVSDTVGDIGAAGGLVGQLVGTLSSSYATGTVSVAASTGASPVVYLGGAIGQNGGTGASLYWNSSYAGVGTGSAVTGAGLNPAQMADASNFAGFDFTRPGNAAPAGGAWGNDPAVNGGLPYLQWQHPYVVVAAADRSFVYNGLDSFATANLGINYAVYVSGIGEVSTVPDVAALLSGTVAFSGSGVDVGSYTVSASGLSLTSAAGAGHTLAFASGTETVTPATLTVTLGGTAGKVYDGTTAATLAGGNYSVSGVFGSDDVSILAGTADYATSNVGTGIVVTAGGLSLTGAKAGDYIVNATASGGIGAITPATLIYTADTAQRTYGAANPGLTGTLTGFVNGETQGAATTGTLGFATSATAGSNVGVYGINGSGLTANHGNYVFVQAAGNAAALTIDPAILTYTADAASRSYGLANPGFTGSVTGFVNGEDQSSATTGTLAFDGSATAASSVGNYGILGNGLTANHGNYTFVQATANGTALTVDPAPLVLALTGTASKTYDGTTSLSFPSANVELSGLFNGDTVTLGGSAAYASADVGAGIGVTVSGVTLSGAAASNYVLSSSTATGNIGEIVAVSAATTATTASAATPPPEVQAVLPTAVTKVNDTASATTSSAAQTASALTADASGAAGGTDKTVGTGSNGDADTGSSTGSGKKSGTMGGTATAGGGTVNPAPGTTAVVTAGAMGGMGAGIAAGTPPPAAIVSTLNTATSPVALVQLKQALQ